MDNLKVVVYLYTFVNQFQYWISCLISNVTNCAKVILWLGCYNNSTNCRLLSEPADLSAWLPVYVHMAQHGIYVTVYRYTQMVYDNPTVSQLVFVSIISCGWAYGIRLTGDWLRQGLTEAPTIVQMSCKKVTYFPGAETLRYNFISLS